MTKEHKPIVAPETFTPMICRPGEHHWRLVHADVLSNELVHRCQRCGLEKTGKYQARIRPPWQGKKRYRKKERPHAASL